MGWIKEMGNLVEPVTIEVLRMLPEAYFVDDIDYYNSGIIAFQKLWKRYITKKRNQAAKTIQVKVKEWFGQIKYANGKNGLYYRNGLQSWNELLEKENF